MATTTLIQYIILLTMAFILMLIFIKAVFYKKAVNGNLTEDNLKSLRYLLKLSDVPSRWEESLKTLIVIHKKTNNVFEFQLKENSLLFRVGVCADYATPNFKLYTRIGKILNENSSAKTKERKLYNLLTK